MHAKLHDLRILYMATALEEMFEGLEKAFDRHLPEDAVRAALRPIFVDGPNHLRLREAYARVNAEVAAAQGKVAPRDLLEAILLCEQSAQRFYEDQAKRLSDPALADLFRGMAHEEGSHVQAVQRALSLQIG